MSCLNDKDSNINCCYQSPCFILGPTGATGPTGPAGPIGLTPTLTATTTTLDPGKEATASFKGTSPNYTLELGIPRGESGPIPMITAMAETVPSEQEADVSVSQIDGAYRLSFKIPKGEMGSVPTITATAKTVDSDKEADVEVQGGGESYQFQFSIPKGPTGPSVEILAYGGIYNTIEQTVTIQTANTPVSVVLPTSMPTRGVTTSTGKVTLEEGGDYLVSYSISLYADTAGKIKSYVRDNGNDITQSQIISEVSQNETILYSNTVITTLLANEALDLVLESNNTGYLTVKNATLTIIKIGT